jgi:hypothetical protein
MEIGWNVNNDVTKKHQDKKLQKLKSANTKGLQSLRIDNEILHKSLLSQKE